MKEDITIYYEQLKKKSVSFNHNTNIWSHKEIKDLLRVQAEEKDKELAVACSEWKDAMDNALLVRTEEIKARVKEAWLRLMDKTHHLYNIKYGDYGDYGEDVEEFVKELGLE